MTDPTDIASERAAWLEGNQRFLAAAWEWLAVLLRERGAQDREPAGRGWWRRTPAAGATAPAESKAVEAARERMEAARREMAPPPIDILADRFGLSPFERDVTLLCAGMALHPELAALCAAAQRDPARPYPTFALALELFDGASWEALAAESPLRFWKLIEVGQAGPQALTTGALRADEWTISVVNGLEKLDDRLSTLLDPLPDATPLESLPPSHQALVERLTAVLLGQPHVIVQLTGPTPMTKRMIAASVAATIGRPLRRLPAEALPAATSELDHLVRLLAREHRLWRLVLYVDVFDTDPAHEAGGAVRRLLAKLEAPVFVDTRDVLPGVGQEAIALDVERPTASEQRVAWEAWLGDAAASASGALSGQFDLDLPAIHRVASIATAAGGDDPEHVAAAAWDACVDLTRPRLATLAQPITPKASWEHLVLPAEELAALREIVHHVRQRSRVYEEWGFAARMNRGLGITALFQGESGTGKTMAAEVLAAELRLALYRIDLAGVVSKYIGETEKNLRRLFDAAEDGGAILFFDEADALFGKRSEVKDSHDRYANIEVNYLLQRMEGYGGLAILATNVRNALDAAFQRRLRFTVNFHFPSLAERRELWRRVFPREVPLGVLDFDRLARLPLTGANIHAVALNAAFLAARTTAVVGMATVLEAAARELQRLNRPVNGIDLRVPKAEVTSA